MIDRLDQRPVQVYLATVIGGTHPFRRRPVRRRLHPALHEVGRGPKPGPAASPAANFTAGRPHRHHQPERQHREHGRHAHDDALRSERRSEFLRTDRRIAPTSSSPHSRVEALQGPVAARRLHPERQARRDHLGAGGSVSELSVTDTTNPNSIRSTWISRRSSSSSRSCDDQRGQRGHPRHRPGQRPHRRSQLVDQKRFPIIGKQELNTTSPSATAPPSFSAVSSPSPRTWRMPASPSSWISHRRLRRQEHRRRKKRSELMIFIQPIVRAE